MATEMSVTYVVTKCSPADRRMQPAAPAVSWARGSCGTLTAPSQPMLIAIILESIGILIIALLLARSHPGPGPGSASVAFDREPLSTDVINMAHIRVAGIGGLGFVAMAAVVAIYIPSIRASLAIGLALGVLFGVGLIVWRRRTGPMPSSGRRPGANTVLSIDEPASQADHHER